MDREGCSPLVGCSSSSSADKRVSACRARDRNWPTWCLSLLVPGRVLHRPANLERGDVMQRAYGLEVPQSLEEVCDPHRLALIVYDMQVGILEQIDDGAAVTAKVAEVLRAARDAGVRIFFSRHMSLPTELMGVFQLRIAMAW